jgi:hypothetical protein
VESRRLRDGTLVARMLRALAIVALVRIFTPGRTGLK